jgi:hypothetical protein
MKNQFDRNIFVNNKTKKTDFQIFSFRFLEF